MFAAGKVPYDGQDLISFFIQESSAMLYRFPPPEWFDSGTTSLFILILCWGITVVGLPATILACLVFPPRSRWLWILAESFWVLSVIATLPLWVPLRFPPLDTELSPAVATAILLILFLLPIPASLAGFCELFKQNAQDRGFRSLGGWVCGLICVVFFGMVTCSTCGGSREAARRSQCKNNLKQIGLAMHNYSDEFGKFPDPQLRAEDSEPMSWRVGILPYRDRKADFANYVPTATWDSDDNFLISKQDVGLYVCPSVPLSDKKDRAGRWYSAYATLVGPQTAFSDGKGKSFREFPDWTSNTVLVAEACGQQIVWTEPRDIDLTDKNVGINLPGNKPGQSNGSWSSYHRDGANVAMADGSVRFLRTATDPRVLRAISTANGGEEVGDF